MAARSSSEDEASSAGREAVTIGLRSIVFCSNGVVVVDLDVDVECSSRGSRVSSSR